MGKWRNRPDFMDVVPKGKGIYSQGSQGLENLRENPVLLLGGLRDSARCDPTWKVFSRRLDNWVGRLSFLEGRVLGTEPGASYVLNKYSTTKLLIYAYILLWNILI